jgi:hypothetical protein
MHYIYYNIVKKEIKEKNKSKRIVTEVTVLFTIPITPESKSKAQVPDLEKLVHHLIDLPLSPRLKYSHRIQNLKKKTPSGRRHDALHHPSCRVRVTPTTPPTPPSRSWRYKVPMATKGESKGLASKFDGKHTADERKKDSKQDPTLMQNTQEYPEI